MGPSLQEMVSFSVNRPGQWERIRQDLYDTVIYATAGATTFTLFALPIGQGNSSAPGNATNPKTIADTNMTLAGQIPAGQNYLVETLEVDFRPGSVSTANTFTTVNPFVWNATAAQGAIWFAATDVYTIYQAGTLKFTVGSKTYLETGPLNKCPPQTHLSVQGAYGTNGAATGAGLLQLCRAEGRPYHIDPVRLENGQNFSVTCNFPVAVATPSGFNGALRVSLDGYLFRASQ